MIGKFLLRNGVTLWLRWLYTRYRLKKRYPGISFGYMSEISGCTFSEHNVIGSHAVLSNVHVGIYSYISGDSRFQNVTIGKFCSLAPGCKIGLGIHPTGFVSTHPAFYTVARSWGIYSSEGPVVEEFAPVVIGNDVWIGYGAIVKDGVRIADGAIVGAGSVVTKDIPPYAIVGGCPAKVLKYRFSQEQIAQLLRIRWWDWDEAKIRSFAPYFREPEKFIDKAL